MPLPGRSALLSDVPGGVFAPPPASCGTLGKGVRPSVTQFPHPYREGPQGRLKEMVQVTQGGGEMWAPVPLLGLSPLHKP